MRGALWLLWGSILLVSLLYCLAAYYRHQRHTNLPPITAAFSCADLPGPAQARILQAIPLEERVSRCALVCRSWSALVASLPADVDVTLASVAGEDKCRQLEAWLGVAGDRTTSLKLLYGYAGDPYSQRMSLQLPCHRLRQLHSLDLQGLQADLLPPGDSGPHTRSATQQADALAALGGSSNGGGSSSSSGGGTDSAALTADGSEPWLPQLRKLRLAAVRLQEQQLLHLSQLTGLTELHLDRVRVCDSSWQVVYGPAATTVIAHLLQHFTGLSVLHMRGVVPHDAVDLISAMQHVQYLSLRARPDFPDSHLAALPLSLTALEFGGLDGQPFTVTPAAQLAGLTNLQRLCLDNVELKPGAFSGLPWLQQLRQFNVKVDILDDLLSEIGCLSQLQHLEMEGCIYARMQPAGQQEESSSEEQTRSRQDGCECFSALTASSQLTAMYCTSAFGTPFPSPAALNYMFPDGRLLPHLAVLHLEGFKHSSHQRDGCLFVGPAQVTRIAHSCPGLRQLVFKRVTPQDFDRACLQQLPAGVEVVLG